MNETLLISLSIVNVAAPVVAFLLLRAARGRERRASALVAKAELAAERAADVIAPSVALALVDGDWDSEAADRIPAAIWDGLYEAGLLRTTSDESGESWPVITREGLRVLASTLGTGNRT